jgi:ketosteroid isomerase-like protein
VAGGAALHSGLVFTRQEYDMKSASHAAVAGLVLLLAGSALAGPPDLAQLRQQVADTERAFAKTMVDRDHAAFTSYLADEAVFFDAERPLVGKSAVADAWAAFFQQPDPPFSWAPENVVVLQTGTLAHSSGPVLSPTGEPIATFNSIWRREPSGEWKIVFDKGSAVCAGPAADGEH